MTKCTRLFLGLLLATVLAPMAQARLTGVNPTGASADIFCVGPVGAEICVDYLGDIIPTTNNDSSLGTSALLWSNIYAVGASMGVSGTANAAGTSGTAASQVINSGVQVYGKVALSGIVTSTTIPVNSSYMTLASTSATTVSITALPSISTTTVVLGSTELPSGTYIILTSTSANGVVFFDAGTLTGSQLQLGASSRVVSQYDVLALVYDATDHFWREVSYTNN